MEEFINAIDTEMPEWKFGHYIKNKEIPQIANGNSDCPVGLLSIIAYFIRFDISQFTKDNLKQLIQLHYELAHYHISDRKYLQVNVNINYCFMQISFPLSDLYDFILMDEFDLNKAFIDLYEDEAYLGDELSFYYVCRALNIEHRNAEALLYIYLYKQLGKYEMIKPVVY